MPSRYPGRFHPQLLLFQHHALDVPVLVPQQALHAGAHEDAAWIGEFLKELVTTG